MKKVKRKLRSQEGASLTFALLLFLVCAAVGSVVLTAGTAAAGRASDTAKYDQRYYSVTSAARLLCDLIDGQSVTVKKVTTTTTKHHYKNGEEVGEPSETIEKSTKIYFGGTDKTPNNVDGFGSLIFDSLIVEAAANLGGIDNFKDKDGEITKTGYNLLSLNEGERKERNLSIGPTLSEGLDTLSVLVNESLEWKEKDDEGIMTFDVSDKLNGGYQYNLQLVFKVEVTPGESDNLSDDPDFSDTSSDDDVEIDNIIVGEENGEEVISYDETDHSIQPDIEKSIYTFTISEINKVITTGS